MNLDANEFINTDRVRRQEYFREYNRILGDSKSFVIERFKIDIGGKAFFLPLSMKNLDIVKALRIFGTWRKIAEEIVDNKDKNGIILKEQELIINFTNERIRYDFEFWAYTCVKIQDKKSKKLIPFKLNYGQRRLLKELESMRLVNVPIRIILVKARQWGGSTLVQIYMLWLQLFHYENWHSTIVAKDKTQASNIRNMIQRTMDNYPPEIDRFDLSSMPLTPNIRMIKERGCQILVTSAETPDATRSFDMAMVHMSEISFWPETQLKSGADLVQALYSTIPDEPGTLIVMESTAKGVGNFFHEQWIAAANKQIELVPVFVPWFQIEIYKRPISNLRTFFNSLTDYNIWQFRQGATLEGINWYNWLKKAKKYSDFQMKSEYPTTAEEAFQSNAGKYFTEDLINYARSTRKNPIFIGDIRGNSLRGENALKGIKLYQNDTGASELLKIWSMPENIPGKKVLHRYLVIVDVGGRTHKADNSIISVLDRFDLTQPGGAIEKVAEWAGHIDHDLLAWKAAQIATLYDNALLVIESNTIDSKDKKKGDDILYEGDHTYTVIDELAGVYDNLYARGVPQDAAIDNGRETKYGWHTNSKTKPLAFDCYTALLREREFVERSDEACNEMDWFEIKKDGTIGAVIGKRDDRMICNAVGSYVATVEMPLPKIMDIVPEVRKGIRQKRSVGAAGF